MPEIYAEDFGQNWGRINSIDINRSQIQIGMSELGRETNVAAAVDHLRAAGYRDVVTDITGEFITIRDTRYQDLPEILERFATATPDRAALIDREDYQKIKTAAVEAAPELEGHFSKHDPYRPKNSAPKETFTNEYDISIADGNSRLSNVQLMDHNGRSTIALSADSNYKPSDFRAMKNAIRESGIDPSSLEPGLDHKTFLIKGAEPEDMAKVVSSLRGTPMLSEGAADAILDDMKQKFPEVANLDLGGIDKNKVDLEGPDKGHIGRPGMAGIVKTAASAAAVTALSVVTANASELPNEAQAILENGGSIEDIAKGIIDSGAYEPLFDRFEKGGFDVNQIAQGIVYQNQGQEAAAHAAYAVGLEMQPELVGSILEQDPVSFVKHHVTNTVGQDAVDNFKQSPEHYMRGAFALSSGNLDSAIKHFYEGAAHQVAAVGDAAMHMGGNEMVIAWEGGDDTLDSVGDTVNVAGDIVIGSTIEFGVGMLKMGVAALGFDPRSAIERDDIHNSIELFAEKGVPAGAPPEVEALVEQWKATGGLKETDHMAGSAIIPLEGYEYNLSVGQMERDGSFKEVMNYFEQDDVQAQIDNMKRSVEGQPVQVADVATEYTTSLTF